MQWNELVVTVQPEKVDDVIFFFNELEIYSLNIDDPRDMVAHQNQVRWDYIDEELLKRDMTKAFVKTYVKEDDDAEVLLNKVKNAGFEACIKKLEAEDWENGWKKYYKPFKLGDKVVIVPAWEEYDKNKDELIIKLDSGMAFGTGTHETTQMCIEFIEKYIKENTKVLDIGTGSGILSICTGLFGAKDVTGVDIDPLAVKIAKENIALNGMSEIITIKEGDLFKKITGKFDVIIANIVADIIKELLPNIDRFLNEDGIFLTSGIITERRDEVYNYAVKMGFSLVDEKEEDGWTALVLKKLS